MAAKPRNAGRTGRNRDAVAANCGVGAMSSASSVKPQARCPISREAFVSKAQPVVVRVGEQPLSAGVRVFSTGSFGWYAGDKCVVMVDGVAVRCQVGITLTAIGSKAGE